MQNKLPTVDLPARSSQRASRKRWVVGLLAEIASLFYCAIVSTTLNRILRSNNAVARVDKTFPVVTAAARTGDMTIYLNGLGCVPNSTITAKSRVDDQLIGALFQESQLVSSEQLTELQQHVILEELYSCLIQPI